MLRITACYFLFLIHKNIGLSRKIKNVQFVKKGKLWGAMMDVQDDRGEGYVPRLHCGNGIRKFVFLLIA
ncbi:hypothetical protein BRE01_38000 [Brevibacillus reuszeri]|uniref:HIRAN domain-containing protein n=1 Tax=Brevibacillus reuszeri TaxID=54915 RepID=A0ABQ0TT75_9BACL|nr:hypothetical protein BRE01_38000 [Brevibacillus reuszeri]